ncbi:MAG: alcohol dehydrogenase catalytic domain-containing protein, partial [Oscillospiraceae bacterium]|nr:alcohol dehydrogenase catalytic domain-containing protein [Oscillospiraceae bacterium]
MRVKAARLYGKNDLRLDEFDFREIKPDEVLAKIICDGVCMSSYKTLQRGKLRSVYPPGNEAAPTIIGHEMAAEIVQVGEAVAGKYKIGDRFGIQAATPWGAPGYSFAEFGGASTHMIVPPHILPSEYVIWFDKDMPFYYAALGEPYACIIFALYSNFHTKRLTRGITMGIQEGGNMAIMGGCGPMGFGGVELVLGMEKRPATLIVTDVDQARIDQAAKVIPPEYAAQKGVKLMYVNTAEMADPVAGLRELTGGEGFHDIFIMCPIKEVIELADAVCAYSCCINFFSGPVDTELK